MAIHPKRTNTNTPAQAVSAETPQHQLNGMRDESKRWRSKKRLLILGTLAFLMLAGGGIACWRLLVWQPAVVNPSWDVEMTPRLPLTGVPYAFQSKQAESLQDAQASFTGTLSFATLTGGNQNFVIADQAAAGTYDLLAAPSGSGYTGIGVELQSSTPGTAQNGNFNVNGTGIVGTLDVSTSGGIDTSSSGTLTIGAANATTINIANSGTKATTINIGTNASVANTVNIGSSNSSANTYLYGGFGLNLTGGVGINLYSGSGGNIYQSLTSSSDTVQTRTTDSTTAFQVKDHSSNSVLDVDTSNSRVGIGTASPGRTLDVAVNSSQVAAPMALLEQAGTGDSSLEFKDPSNSFYMGQDASGSNALVISSGYAATHDRSSSSPYLLGYNSITHSVEDAGNSTLIASMPFTTSLAGTISQISVDLANDVAGDHFAVAIYADSGSNHPGVLLASSPSTAITINTADGDNWNTATLSSSVSLSASTKYWLAYEIDDNAVAYWLDQTKGNVCWQAISGGSFGTWTPTNSTTCDNGYNANTYGIDATVTPTGSSHSLTDTFSNPLFTLSQDGNATFEGTSDSASAFQVQDPSGVAVLNVDTTSQVVQVASTIDTTTNTPLVLGNANATGVDIGNTGVNNLTTIYGSTLIKSATGLNSTTAFQVQNADGSNTVLNVDTTNSHFTINGYTIINQGGVPLALNSTGSTPEAGILLQVTGTNEGEIGIAGSTGHILGQTTANDLALKSLNGSIYLGANSSSNASVKIANGGAALFQNNTNSTTAFQVQASGSFGSGSSVFDVDTTNKRVGIGTNSPSSALDVAVNNTSTIASTLLLEQAGTGDTSLQLKASNSDSYFIGADASDSNRFKISSSTTAGGTSTLGNTATSGTTDSSDNGAYSCSLFTATSSGTLSSVTVTYKNIDTTNKLAQAAIYSNSGGNVGSLLGSSSSVTLSSAGQQTFDLNSGASVASGTSYWLCTDSNTASTSTNNLVYNAGSTGQEKDTTTGFTFGTWPSSMPTATFTAANQFEIYATINLSTTDEFSGSLFSLTQSGQTVFQNSANSTSAFQVQNASGGAAFDVDTANGRVGIGTTSPNAQLEVGGSTYLGTQVLTANDQADVCLFGNSSCGAAQSGAFNNQLNIFGGSSQTRHLFLYQAASGNAFIGSSFANLVIETTSNNANIWLEPNGTGKVISDTIYAINPSTGNSAEGWHNFTIPSGWSDNSGNGTGFRYRLEPDGTVLLSVNMIAASSVSNGSTVIATFPTGYIPASGQNIALTSSNQQGSGSQSPHFFINTSGQIKYYGINGSAVLSANGIIVLDN